MQVLVPVAVLEGESLSPGLVDLLATTDVVLLGYHVLPDQTPPDQARAQFEDRAQAALDDLAEAFGDDVETRLVFTQDRQQTIERTADETNADAYVIGGPAGEIDALLVSLSGEIPSDDVLTFVEAMIGDRDVGVTLLRAGEAAGADATGDRLDAAAERLETAGIDTRTERVPDSSPFDALVDAVPGHDAVVLGERAPSLSSILLGDEPERVAAATAGPVLVVRNPDEAAE